MNRKGCSCGKPKKPVEIPPVKTTTNGNRIRTIK